MGKLKPLFRKELTLLYLAGFLQLSTVMTSFTLVPLYVRHVGGGDFAIGIQATIFTLFSVILRLFLGPLADSRGRKLALLLGGFAFATAPAAIWFSPNLTVMALARVWQAVGMASFLSAATSYVADHAPQGLRGAAIGMYRTAVTLSVMVAPALGMELIGRFGFGSYFLYSIICGSLGTLLVFFLPEKIGERHHHGDADELAVGPKELAQLFRIPDLRSAYLGIFMISMANGVLLTYLALHGGSYPEVGNPAFHFTIRAGIGAVGASALGSLSDRFGRMRMLLPAIGLFALGTWFLSFMDRDARLFYYLSAVISGFGFAGALSLMITGVVDAVPSRLRASALAFQESAIDGGNALGIFLFGLALTRYALGEMFPFLALFILAILPVYLVSPRGGGRTALDGQPGGEVNQE